MGTNQDEAKKDNRIKREFSRLKRLFQNLPENELKFVEPLLQNCAFMRAVLEDLQELITENGLIDDYQNGENQNGRKMSAELQAYNTTVKNYNQAMDKLIERLPKEEKKSAMVEMMRRYS